MNRNAWRKVFSMLLMLCMFSCFAAQAREEAAVEPQYTIKVDGKHGEITLNNTPTTTYDQVYVRYSVGYSIASTPYAVIISIKVEWDETQEGVVGTFVMPNIQGSGEFTGASYIVTTNANADELGISQAAKGALGILIR